MTLLRKLFLNLSIIGITICATNTALAHGGNDFTNYPASMCRAAVESQDKHFRVWNNRYKNTSPWATYIICPVPTTLESGDGSQAPNDVWVSMSFLNEGGNPVLFSCTLYGFSSQSPTVPAWFSSNQANIPSGETGLAGLRAEGINQGGSFPNNSFHYNAVCLLPPEVSLTGFEVVQVPQN